jgi:uracil-DNA glycosylase
MQFSLDDGAKRQKLAPRFTAGSSSSNTTPTSSPPTNASFIKRRALGTQRLNSIPFSLSAFVDSLPTDARALLALECDTMGKSWLKLLADELAKPYFVDLKRFLYAEGVKGAGDRAPPKIYPQRESQWSSEPVNRC